MSDSAEDRIGPVLPLRGVQPVRAVQLDRRLTSQDQGPELNNPANAATAGGHLSPAYAQLAFNPDTDEAVIRVRDGQTDQVLDELPAAQVEKLTHELKDYVEVARRRGVLPLETAD